MPSNSRRHLFLSLQPLMLGYAVDWNKRQDDGRALDVGLELGVFTIDLCLAQLKAASTTKHHIDDADITQRRNNPLP